MRNSLEVAQELYARPDFATSLVFKPEKHYTLDENDVLIRAYSDMWTGKWWWKMQVRTLTV